MKAQITFKQLNPDFDKERADQLFDGKDSHDNSKENWNRTLGFDVGISGINIKEDTTYQTSDCQIKNVTIFEYLMDDGTTEQFIVSKSLIANIHLTGKSNYNTSHLYIYFKNTNDFHRLGEQLYISYEDFPPELTKYIGLE